MIQRRHSITSSSQAQRLAIRPLLHHSHNFHSIAINIAVTIAVTISIGTAIRIAITIAIRHHHRHSPSSSPIIHTAINTVLATAVQAATMPLPQSNAPTSVHTIRTDRTDRTDTGAATGAVNKPPPAPSPSLTDPQSSPSASTNDAEYYKQVTLILSLYVALLSLALVGLVAFFIYRRCTFRTTTRRVPSARSR
ncbi:hypothetical protein V8F33_012023 [Rhypophila sp. PSN 637]